MYLLWDVAEPVTNQSFPKIDCPGTGLLVLVRHGQSTDNETNLFSGLRDVGLTARGIEEARSAGRKLRGTTFDAAYTSLLRRARSSLDVMLEEMGQQALPIESNAALNERDYGDLAGRNKEEACAIWGEAHVRQWRKSFNGVPPSGESLAMTTERMLPFWCEAIEPRVRGGGRVLVVAHGNSLRAIVKHIERLPVEDVDSVHIATSEVIRYRIDGEGDVLAKCVDSDDREM